MAERNKMKKMLFILIGYLVLFIGCASNKGSSVKVVEDFDTTVVYINYSSSLLGTFKTADSVTVSVDSLKAEYLFIYPHKETNNVYTFKNYLVIQKGLKKAFGIYDVSFVFEESEIFTDRALMWVKIYMPYQTEFLELSAQLSTVPGDKNYQGPQRVISIKHKKTEKE